LLTRTGKFSILLGKRSFALDKLTFEIGNPLLGAG